MDKKNIITSLILFSLIFSMLSVVFAATNVNINDNTLTISDFDFKIPDGYSEDESQRNLDSDIGSNHQDSTVIFKNNDKKINITIRSSTDGGTITDFSNTYGTNETIGGIDGSYLTDTSKITDNNVAFLYAKDGKGIYISAPDKETIEEILK